MSDIRKLIQEKFGFTKDLPSLSDMHKDADADKKPVPAAHPLEKFRNVIKALMGSTTTEEDGILENAIDFTALQRLANKHGFGPSLLNSFNIIELEMKKPVKGRDTDLINKTWDGVKKEIPFWFMGLIAPKKGEDIEEYDKKNITNLLTVMDKINKVSEKTGKEAAKETEVSDRKTEAKKNLDDAKKGNGDALKDAGSEKKLNKEPEAVKSVEAKAEEPKLPEDESKKEAPKEKKKD